MQLINFHTCNFYESWSFAKNRRLNTREYFWIYGKDISIMTIDGLANCHFNSAHVCILHTYISCMCTVHMHTCG